MLRHPIATSAALATLRAQTAKAIVSDAADSLGRCDVSGNPPAPYGPPPYGQPSQPPRYAPPPQYGAPPYANLPAPVVQGGGVPPEGDKNYLLTVLLSFFFGMFGIDRFYLGKVGTGLAKLFTFGGWGIWYLIDLLMTLFGAQRDAQGRRLAGYEKNKTTAWIIVGAVFGAGVLANILLATIAASVGSDGPTPFGWGLLGLIAAGGVTLGAIAIGRRRKKNRAAEAARVVDPVPARIRARLHALAALRMQYTQRSVAGDQVAGAVGSQIDALVQNVSELFRRLAAKSDAQQRGIAEVEYDDKLARLARALGDDYLLDLLAHPRLWEDPDRRAREVQSALGAVDAQVIANIRQVNAHRGLVFEVALDGLMGPRKAHDDWQRDFDQAAGDR